MVACWVVSMEEKAIKLLAMEIVILVILKTYKCFGMVLLFICFWVHFSKKQRESIKCENTIFQMQALDNCTFPFYIAVYLTQVLENKGVDIYFWS